MKGVIAAGGTGSRLAPLTMAVNKHLLPIHDKPMVFYALSTIMAAQIREITIVTTPNSKESFERLLGHGSTLGVNITYVVQVEPSGVADVLVAAANLVSSGPVALILADNFFYGPGLGRRLAEIRPHFGGHVFATSVSKPQDYGVVVLDSSGSPVSIVEKPTAPESDLAVTGLYFYGRDVWDELLHMEPSRRGELEITDLNRKLLESGRLTVELLPRGTVWLDAGSVEALEQVSEFVAVLQERQGLYIGCPEEIAFRNGWITADDLHSRARQLDSSPYGGYLARLANLGSSRD